VKQGLMQDLLGKGERMKLERCLRICYGKDQKQIEATDGIYPILGSGGEMGRTNTYLYNKPSVLIGRKGTIDNPLYIETPFWSIDTMYYTEIFNGYLPKYLYYVFTLIPWYKYNEASGVPSLSGSTIHKIEVNIPDLNEQIRIVEILTAADERLNIERERLKKLEHIKLGLMNDLLTSRVSTDVLQGGN
jgi:type I restriction enzyme S subunit